MADAGAGVVRATAPAKLNLGLAIAGRRSDGFHELRSIFQTITLTDRLALRRRPAQGGLPAVVLGKLTSADGRTAIDDPGLAGADNLAVRAVASTLSRIGSPGEFSLSLAKGIPAASGLGGASADAAAAILMTEAATGAVLSAGERLALAAELGSDVPFFLTGGTALVGGRGERVDSLSDAAPVTFIVVFPALATPIVRKTARLFAALLPEDFDPGDAVVEQAERLRAGLPIDPALLGNGFSRALLALAPELGDLQALIRAATGRAAALSGAGPAHYVVEPDPDRATRQAAALRQRLGDRAQVFVGQPWRGPPSVERSERRDPKWPGRVEPTTP